MATTPQYSGGYELKAAFQALTGRGGRPDHTAASPLGSPSSASSAWFIPPHLLRLPAHREAALQAHDWAVQASKRPEDYESVYQYGLALQELAARLTASPADQLSLLQQVGGVCAQQRQWLSCTWLPIARPQPMARC